MESFGQRLKAARESKGMTQQALADAAGFSQPFIARLEKDRQEPSWGTVQALAKALGVDCRAFQDDAQAEAPKPAKKRKGKGA